MSPGPPHILCVNPWIHDFAAYDFWARPMGLLYLASILRRNHVRISFIDCLDRFHPAFSHLPKVLWDGRGPFHKQPVEPPPGLDDVKKNFSRYGIEPQWLKDDLASLDPPDLVMVTSQMTYWASGVRETIAVIKSVWPDAPVVLGGVYATLCREHAMMHSLADEVISFAGEPRLAQIVNKYTGFVLDEPADFFDLDSLPYPAFDLQRQVPYVPILTSRGCPFSCDYCASSFLEPVLRQRSFSNVFAEIEYWHTRFGVKNFPFYDDALLVNMEKYAFPLLETLIESDVDAWFHTPNALHIRQITPKAAELMYRAGFKTIRLGLETTDFSADRPHDVKVKAAEFHSALTSLKKAGFKRSQIGAYLLCGLPGQDLDQVAVSVETVKQAGILPVLAYYTPIPHTRMWNDAVQNSRYNIEKYPACTNNTVFPCLKSHRDINRISQLKN